MKLLLFGSGEFGLPTFEALRTGHEVAAVVTQPDRPAGRKRVLTPTPVASWAGSHGLACHKAEDVNTEAFVEQVRAYEAEASVVIAFGQKLSPALIEAMGKLAVNLHASLLPRYRGAAPINRAMIAGESTTGVSVIGLAQKMDAGEVYAAAALDIDPMETAGELHDRLAQLGPGAVLGVLDDLDRGTLAAHVQDHAAATRAPKLTKADGTVDFNQPAAAVRARIHGLTPWPGCRVTWRCQKTGKATDLALHRVRDLPDEAHDVAPGVLLEGLCVACGSGAVQLLQVQPPGKGVMEAQAFARGRPMAAGDELRGA